MISSRIQVYRNSPASGSYHLLNSFFNNLLKFQKLQGGLCLERILIVQFLGQ